MHAYYTVYINDNDLDCTAELIIGYFELKQDVRLLNNYFSYDD